MPERRVWRIDRAGDLTRLEPGHEPLGEPGTGQVQVRVRAIGLNFADIFACLGLYSATPRGPFIPGLEFAGEVSQVGSDCTGFEKGDRVMGVTRFGGYVSDLNSDARYLMKMPESWSFEQGAGFIVQTATAWYAIQELGSPRERPTVLLHSAAGGVGLRALVILKELKATVVATVGEPSKVQFLEQHAGLPGDQVIVRDPARFDKQLDEVLASLGEPGFDLVLDSVAGPYFWPGFQRLRATGRSVVYGSADFMPAGSRPNRLKLFFQYLKRPRLDPLKMISQNRSVMAFNLIWLWNEPDLLAAGFEAMQRYLTPPHVGRVFEFDSVPGALRHLQSGRSVGKVVVRA